MDSDLASVQRRIHTARSKALGHDASIWTLQREEVSESIEDDGSVVEHVQQVRNLHPPSVTLPSWAQERPKREMCLQVWGSVKEELAWGAELSHAPLWAPEIADPPAVTEALCKQLLGQEADLQVDLQVLTSVSLPSTCFSSVFAVCSLHDPRVLQDCDAGGVVCRVTKPSRG